MGIAIVGQSVKQAIFALSPSLRPSGESSSMSSTAVQKGAKGRWGVVRTRGGRLLDIRVRGQQAVPTRANLLNNIM